MNVLADLARVAETKHGKLIGAQLIDITARVAAVREDAVKVGAPIYSKRIARIARIACHRRG